MRWVDCGWQLRDGARSKAHTGNLRPNVRRALKNKASIQEQPAFEGGEKRASLTEIENGQRNVGLVLVEKLAKALMPSR